VLEQTGARLEGPVFSATGQGTAVETHEILYPEENERCETACVDRGTNSRVDRGP